MKKSFYFYNLREKKIKISYSEERKKKVETFTAKTLKILTGMLKHKWQIEEC
jgi:CRISPR/Cas system-associated exonuclease Cas4 (RecB family)